VEHPAAMSETELQALDDWMAPMLEALSPGARGRLSREIATTLRRSQQQRIARQENPDGTPFDPRKRKGARAKAGRIKRRAMFSKLRLARFMKMSAGADEASVGFTGRTARIAQVHQEGGTDAAGPDGPTARYPRRRLLGLTPEDRDRIREQLLAHLTP